MGRFVREFHDLTARTALAGDQEVVCHNDLSPKNTVYTDDGTRAIAFIDWDIAAPAAASTTSPSSAGSTPTSRASTGLSRTWKALLAGYGPADLTALVPTVLWWQSRTADGIDAQAAAGDPAMQHLRDLDIPKDIRRTRAWVERCRVAASCDRRVLNRHLRVCFKWG